LTSGTGAGHTDAYPFSIAKAPLMRSPAWLPALFLAFSLATGPAAAETVLRWASQGDALTMDPHAQNEGMTVTMARQIYETLVFRTPALETAPGLATRWEMKDPTTWVFTLREGVTFHDGTPFTADDVVFSIERAQTPPSDFRNTIDTIAAARASGPLEVTITTRGPNVILPLQMNEIFIMSRAWAEKHGVTRAQNRGGGEETYAVRHANGTGPFKLDIREPDTRTVMVRNENWWGAAAFPGNIERLEYTPVANAATRVAALLSGRLDFVLDTPLQDLPRVERTPGFKLTRIPEVRTIFLGLDVASAELRSSNVKGKNPFAAPEIREAMAMAIDADAITRRIMRGQAVPAGIVAGPGIRGYSEALDRRPPLDPAKAKALLAEAGYPEGFSVTLDCPNDRYVNDEQICQAVVGMLARIGITVTLDLKTRALHFPKIEQRRSDFYMLGWGNPSLDPLYTFRHLTMPDSPWSAHGWRNERMFELVSAMAVEADTGKRDAMIAEAWNLLKAANIYLPLHHQVLAWTTVEKLDLPIQADNQPQFRYARMSP
jgi:peptide/nickel transport system substrate-binding protein